MKRPRSTPIVSGSGPHALREAKPVPYWLDGPEAPAARPALTGADACDLAVVGAGFTGLWTALLAKQQDPVADVIVLEAGATGARASGRNGGICMASLTHGFSRGEELFPKENRRLTELGNENLAAIERSVRELSIDCAWERTGELETASAPWHVDGLRETFEQAERAGVPSTWLDGEELRSEIHSPTYHAGFWHHDAAILDPARLAWGLARACEERGVRIYEGTPVTALARAGGGVELRTPWGAVRARRAVLATNAFRPLLRRVRLHVVPVYDYALMTEPLSAAQLELAAGELRLFRASYRDADSRLPEELRGWAATVRE